MWIFVSGSCVEWPSLENRLAWVVSILIETNFQTFMGSHKVRAILSFVFFPSYTVKVHQIQDLILLEERM